jgi:hypothetical protein
VVPLTRSVDILIGSSQRAFPLYFGALSKTPFFVVRCDCQPYCLLVVAFYLFADQAGIEAVMTPRRI